MSRARRQRLLDLLTWAATSLLLLAGGLAALFTGLATLWTGSVPGELQRQVWLLLARAVFAQALLPLWIATLASWLALARLAPGLDAAWRTLAPGIAVVAALWFAPVGALSFRIWSPQDARDVLGTLLLCAGGISAALLLPRFALRRLAPGVFSSQLSAGPGL